MERNAICCSVWREHGDTFFLARSESILALVAQAQGAPAEAVQLAEAGVEDWRANGHPCNLAMGLWVLSDVLFKQDTVARAEQAAREGLHLGAWLQDPWSTGSALLQLGTIVLAHGEPAEARPLIDESLRIFTELGDPWSRGRALLAAGWMYEAQQQHDAARGQFEQALQIARATELGPLVVEAQYALASLMQADAPAAALTFLEQLIAHPAAEQATRARAMAPQAALRAAEGGTPAAAEDPQRGVREGLDEALTAREVEVLGLLAQGCSNGTIATELVVAVGTVKRHVNNICGKLQAQSRLQAVVRARELGLV